MTTTVTTAETGPLTANGVTPLAFTFQALSAAEILVYRNGVLATSDSYTVTLNEDGTGVVTPLGTWSADSVMIYSVPNYQQLTHLERFIPAFPDLFNKPLDRLARTIIGLRAAIVRELATLTAQVVSITTYLLAVPGAVARTITAKLSDAPHLRDFGAPTGSNDWQIPLTNAIAALNAGTIGLVWLPWGGIGHSAALPPINRGGVSILGPGNRVSLIKPQGNFDSLRFVSPTPLLAGGDGRISDINLKGFGIDYGDVTAPTGGVALTLDRVDRSYIDIEINNAFQGLLMRGGADIHLIQCTISSAYSWAALAVGSYLVKFTNYPGTTEHPSEIQIGPVNWKGSDNKLERAVIIECGDGIFWSSGHIGFAHLNQVYVNAQPGVGLSIRNIHFGTVYFDGNSAGSTAGAMIEFTGSNTPNVVEGIDLQNATIRNHPGVGFKSTLTQMRDLKINNCQFSNLGKHITITGAQDFSISGNSFRDGNALGAATTNAVDLTNCLSFVVHANRFMAGSGAVHPVALNIVTSSDMSLVGNLFSGHTTDMLWAAGSARIAYSANRRIGSDVTVAAVNNFTVPLGYDEFDMTGTATITGINVPPIKGMTFQINMIGTPTFTDGASLKLASNFVATADSTLTLRTTGSAVAEVSRAIV